jgi:hypothetical protein
MPGPDDMGHVLSLQDALNLTSFVKTSNLKGVMTWDANTDATGLAGNAPYAYSMGIQTMLPQSVPTYTSLTLSSKRLPPKLQRVQRLQQTRLW